MTDKADHLIERAAALLRSGRVARVAQNGEAATASGARPVPMPAHALGAGSHAPVYVPSRPTQVYQHPSAHTQPPLPGSGSAAGIPPSPDRPPLSLEALEQAGLMVLRNKRTRVAEEYRIVIGRVLRALHAEPEKDQDWNPVAPNAVMVTSARPREGKSFTALNLAASIALNAAESVLLLDLDPKLAPLSDQLGLSEREGFLDLVSRPDLSPDDLVIPTELAQLSILPLGTRESRQAAVVDPGQVRLLTPALQRISQRYPKSLIMLDVPPCLSASDPSTLAPHVGQIVMVVEAERTQRGEVEAALELVRVCPTVTMLLNKVRMAPSHTFGAYDYFGTYS